MVCVRDHEVATEFSFPKLSNLGNVSFPLKDQSSMLVDAFNFGVAFTVRINVHWIRGTLSGS